ncbi:2-polyprenyl-6-methoxyphenol hydroxylase [Streptomyces spiroverticillatus]|uniref:2-polyprenyl-6-methoxyphenol hydroxylase n=1 Tax=Streptomyces finlayi TaxID=67296 RepID=A0A918WUS6_9ACTN|nr:FAD-dependent monooxygenase [Streptomyces finlayi]GHA01670.1 2-polyprenyl-6-methoxyphenol hydroxylase [Streptomyces spiroverticillatus]GHC86020.1 2-polyprenyl-6-methoxyphenol hydroxylase [Streptomyces finlayi]
MIPHARLAVIGSSIAGCAAALAVQRAGAASVTVFERTGGRLAARGVGLAVHGERYKELEAAGFLDAAMPYVPLTHRTWYVKDNSAPSPLGRALSVMPFAFRTYSWGSLWRELRARVPEAVEFRPGVAVKEVRLTSRGAELDGEAFDAVVGADGYRSVVRTAACPGTVPEYSGSLAWRGAYAGAELPDAHLWPVDECAYVVFDGGHIVIYRIPDDAGGHRVNWVFYTTPPAGHTLPPDGQRALTADLAERLTDITRHQLPPFFAALIEATPTEDRFVQPLYDFTAPQYATDRLALVGDAATVARPHTGAGAVKALQDATALQEALRAAPSAAEGFAAYDAQRAPVGRTMVDLGRSLGRALVQETPDWSAMRDGDLEAFWSSADGSGAFGGRELKRG